MGDEVINPINKTPTKIMIDLKTDTVLYVTQMVRSYKKTLVADTIIIKTTFSKQQPLNNPITFDTAYQDDLEAINPIIIIRELDVNPV